MKKTVFAALCLLGLFLLYPSISAAVPPAAPSNFAVAPDSAFLRFSWSASPESDVASYNVQYRGPVSGSLNLGNRTSFGFIPPPALTGSFTFTITAVNAAGEESAPSNQQSANFPVSLPRYVGSETCDSCHREQYNDFVVSSHPYKLRRAEDARRGRLPLPEGYTWDDISYVIGGNTWKARYMGNDGFIITSTGPGRNVPGRNQYNIENDTWSDYSAGQRKLYDCGNCHNTGYSVIGNQDGLPGIVGTWAFPGVQCERCHGPGSEHVANPQVNMQVDTSSAACGQCHVRGNPSVIPAERGFIEHREQYNEILASPHQSITCVTCHNPHKRAEFSIIRTCDTCHSQENQDFTGSRKQFRGLTCTDCHMPEAAKSAISRGPYQADVKSHLFRINLDPTATMFNEEGNRANGFLTVEFSCLSCHPERDRAWALANAPGIHRLGK